MIPKDIGDNVISFYLLTSMLTGADVRGWRYSGCSKWPLCAVNIFMIRMGSRLAWREGSVGEGQDVGTETDGLSAPVRWGSPLASAALRSGDCLRKSGSGPPGGSLIWIWAGNWTMACNERTQGWNSFTSTFHDDIFNRRESAVIQKGKCAVRVHRVGPKLSLKRNKSPKCHPLSGSSITPANYC